MRGWLALLDLLFATQEQQARCEGLGVLLSCTLCLMCIALERVVVGLKH